MQYIGRLLILLVLYLVLSKSHPAVQIDVDAPPNLPTFENEVYEIAWGGVDLSSDMKEEEISYIFSKYDGIDLPDTQKADHSQRVRVNSNAVAHDHKNTSSVKHFSDDASPAAIDMGTIVPRTEDMSTVEAEMQTSLQDTVKTSSVGNLKSGNEPHSRITSAQPLKSPTAVDNNIPGEQNIDGTTDTLEETEPAPSPDTSTARAAATTFLGLGTSAAEQQPPQRPTGSTDGPSGAPDFDTTAPLEETQPAPFAADTAAAAHAQPSGAGDAWSGSSGLTTDSDIPFTLSQQPGPSRPPAVTAADTTAGNYADEATAPPRPSQGAAPLPSESGAPLPSQADVTATASRPGPPQTSPADPTIAAVPTDAVQPRQTLPLLAAWPASSHAATDSEAAPATSAQIAPIASEAPAPAHLGTGGLTSPTLRPSTVTTSVGLGLTSVAAARGSPTSAVGLPSLAVLEAANATMEVLAGLEWLGQVPVYFAAPLGVPSATARSVFQPVAGLEIVVDAGVWPSAAAARRAAPELSLTLFGLAGAAGLPGVLCGPVVLLSPAGLALGGPIRISLPCDSGATAAPVAFALASTGAWALASAANISAVNGSVWAASSTLGAVAAFLVATPPPSRPSPMTTSAVIVGSTVGAALAASVTGLCLWLMRRDANGNVSTRSGPEDDVVQGKARLQPGSLRQALIEVAASYAGQGETTYDERIGADDSTTNAAAAAATTAAAAPHSPNGPPAGWEELRSPASVAGAAASPAMDTEGLRVPGCDEVSIAAAPRALQPGAGRVPVLYSRRRGSRAAVVHT